MAASFGVQLKKACPPEGSEGQKGSSVTPGGARRSDIKAKPVSDLKAMFNQKDEEAKSSEIGPKKTVASSSTTTSSTASVVTGPKRIAKTVKTDFNSSSTQKSKLTSKLSSEMLDGGLSEEDRKAFAALQQQMKVTGINDLAKTGDEPKLAVAKTYSGGGVYKATFESKTVHKAGDESNAPANKSAAASLLSSSLTKLRIRPGSGKTVENGKSDIKLSANGASSPRSQSPKPPTSPISKDFKKDNKYIPGVAKGWKSSVNNTAECSNKDSRKPGLFDDSSVGKVRTEVKTETEVKVKGFRSVSPVNYSRNSSDESSGSSNLSPRGYRANTEYSASKTDRDEVKTDINKNIKKFESSSVVKSETTKTKAAETSVFKTNTNNQSPVKPSGLKKTNSGTNVSETKSSLTRTDSKPKMSAVEQLALDKERLRAKRNSGSFSSDSEKGKRSPKTKANEFKWMDKSRISLEEFKQQAKVKAENTGHRPLSRASSSGSNSSLTRGEAVGMKSRINRFGSPESKSGADSPKCVSPDERSGFKKREFLMSKKINPDRFKDIKKGFETRQIDNRTPSPADRKPFEIKTETKLLERKKSFEDAGIFRQKSVEKKEVISPRDRGKINVLETVKALTELDARAKAKPVIARRTQSLPTDSYEEDNDSLGGYYDDVGQEEYYQEISGGARMGDDVSNEGDISSEADLIYEEIPAHVNPPLADDSRKDFKERRATAFKKKRKSSEEQGKTEQQAGTEGDIDSDSDSSNSGIYEHVDNERHNVSGSDSAPELPAPRTQNSKKKKKKEPKGEKEEKEKKGLKGKLKQLYSNTKGGGKTSESDSSVFSKIKNLKKSKASSSGTNLEAMNKEEVPVCDSTGTDTDGDVDPNSQRSSRSDEGSVDNQLAPPPLPPRQGELNRASSGSDIPNKLGNENIRSSTGELNNRPNSGTYQNSAGRKSPPLPPRNRISNNLDLNVVVPVNPGGEMRKSGWPPGKDSYLHTQKVQNASPTSPEMPYIDGVPTQRSPKPPPPPSSDAPKLPSRPTPIAKQREQLNSRSSYEDCEGMPPVPPRPTSKSPLKQKDSYVDVGDDPLPDNNYSLADEIRTGPGRKELEKRPISSSYIQPHDLSTVPEPRNLAAPFTDVIKFCSQYDEDGLYIDLFSGHFVRKSDMKETHKQQGMYCQLAYCVNTSDDQVYGTAGRFKSQFESESLYQFYNKDKIHRASRRKAIYSSFDESDEEDDSSVEKDSVYEDLSEYSSGRGSMDLEPRRVEEDTSATPSKISTLEMFGKKGTVMRSLWSEMPEVKASGMLDKMTSHDRKIQESIFEIITSEATYLKSLNVLMDGFLCSEEFGSDHSNKCVITRQERHVIFSNIGAIRDTSERFLTGLEGSWKKSVMLVDICDIIAQHASKNFECYIHYCSNQVFQDRAITDLKKRPDFAEALRRLEASPACQGLPMISFLLLPMQRVTRLPLLVDAICHRLDPSKDKDRHKSATNAFNALSKVVKRCNDGAKKMQQTEQMYHIAKQIEFSANKEIPQIPLISASRYLVKQGEVVRIASDGGTRLPFGKSKAGKVNQNIYLFNDMLVITKKKGDRYQVVDYGQRNTLHIEVIDNPEKFPRHLPNGVPSGCKNLFLMVMLENYEKKQVEIVFACNSLSDRARWVDAVTPVHVADDQRIYEEWDCPQVQCIKHYTAQEPDELSLEESDVVNVFKKLDDGMYEGERLRDGERGWFPKDHTIEIVNSHTRARNLRMKYRLQAASEYGS